jgi:hypothetical protein
MMAMAVHVEADGSETDNVVGPAHPFRDNDIAVVSQIQPNHQAIFHLAAFAHRPDQGELRLANVAAGLLRPRAPLLSGIKSSSIRNEQIRWENKTKPLSFPKVA